MVFVEDTVQLHKVQEAFGRAGKKIPLLLFSGSAPGIKGFEELSSEDKMTAQFLQKCALSVKPSDMATIVYTSGTTGVPKGAVLTHSNLASEIQGVMQAVRFLPDDITLTFLPFAHILGRVESLLPIFSGITLGFAESINSVPQNLGELRPSILVSVPRIYEKIFSKIQSEIAAAPKIKQRIFNWAVSVGRQMARSEQAGGGGGDWVLKGKHKVADRLVFEKIRNKLGGNIRFTVSGGAPLSAELCEFFHACSVRILEGYGLTETTAAVTCNRLEEYAFGTVGKPVSGTSIRIAEDGEIQIQGPLIFKEYFKNPEATRESFTPDGWFCTGDIGEFTERGFLKITDRKKELIVTSGGKNVAPQKLENLLKTNVYVSNAMVYGDKQKYIVALLAPNEPELLKWARERGMAADSITAILAHPDAQKLYELAVQAANENLASYESIKKFKIVAQDFMIETGELTPSLKIKRKVITAKYKKLIDQMYENG
jgi:long-chain acyl-CoA synthetase